MAFINLVCDNYAATTLRQVLHRLIDLQKELTGSDSGNFLKEADGALQLAAYQGCYAAVELLLSVGVDPNIHHPLFGYALHNAACAGHSEIVRLLNERGSASYTRGAPDTLLELTAKRGHSTTYRYLLDTTPGRRDKDWLKGYLTQACDLGHEGIVRELPQWADAQNSRSSHKAPRWIRRAFGRQGKERPVFDRYTMKRSTIQYLWQQVRTAM